MMYIKKERQYPYPVVNGFKKCSKCGIEKPLDKFLFEKNRKQYRAECKDCTRTRIRIKFNQKSNEEEFRLRKEKARKKADQTLKNGSKRCNRCGKEKELKDFIKQRNKGSFDGYQNTCKQCKKIYWKNPQHCPSNLPLPEKIKELVLVACRSNFKIVFTDKERKEKKTKSQTYKYWHDIEFRRQRLRYSKEHHKKDRSKMLARKHKREALMLNQHDGTVTTKEIKRILEERKTCPYCGNPIGKAEIDHMDPISKGGLHSASNIIGCCHKCNSKKHTKSFVEWLSFIKEERRDYIIRLYEKKHGARPEQGTLPLKYAA
jgi:hypothetical protein